jgi:hypothetical protein
MALLARFRKQQASLKNLTTVVNEMQDFLLEFSRELSANPIVNGELIEAVELNSTTATLVRHGLGFQPRGVLSVKKLASFHVFEDSTAENPDPRQFVALKTSSGIQTVNLWVF